ncbi:MAG TPA: rod shape-determining protein MreC, partial [Nitrospiraceae bacterium]
MWMVNFRSPSGTRRLVLVSVVLLLIVLFLLPSQSQGLLQYVSSPLGEVLSLPIQAISSIDHAISELWGGYVGLQMVRDENEQLRKDIEVLRGQNSQLRESAAATERLKSLLQFKEQAASVMVAAQVIGRDATNSYRSVILNKGERDGIKPDMGVVTPVGVVGRV